MKLHSIGKLVLLACLLGVIQANESIDLCGHCSCLLRPFGPKVNYFLDCSRRKLNEIPSNGLTIIGGTEKETELFVSYSNNAIKTLGQLPATEANVHFVCSECELRELASGLFLDVPNILSIDLSSNDLSDDNLFADVFRGRYQDTMYEPIGVTILNLSFNKITRLASNIFEHMPKIRELNLSHNSMAAEHIENTLRSIDSIGGTLEILDISYTGISSLADEFVKPLSSLRNLNLAGNNFETVPESLSLIGSTLQVLNLDGNPITKLVDESFLGLKALRILNINNLPKLDEIEDGTFSQVHSLEVLACHGNLNLDRFPIGGLSRAHRLIELDLRNNAIESLSTFLLNTTDGTLNGTIFPSLRHLQLGGNDWGCTCELHGTMNRIFSSSMLRFSNARCDTPFHLTSNLIYDLTQKEACTQSSIKKPIGFDPPPFLRPKHLLLSIMSIVVVILIGLMVGLCVVFIKRKLKKNDLGFASPIRYTTVRNSTISV